VHRNVAEETASSDVPCVVISVAIKRLW